MLDPATLIRIGTHGIGNPRSRVAHSCAVFRDRLYLGVTHPNGEGPEDAARILRYDFDSEDWTTVHTSPLRAADDRAFAADILRAGGGRRVVSDEGVPRERGFRGMCVFQGKSDAEPALYVSTISNWGGLILRSGDGESFEVVSKPGLGDDRLLSFRALVPFKGRLFTTPIGSISEGKLDRNGTIEPTVFVSDDPAKGTWAKASLPGFGDARNGVIFQLAPLGDHLYAGTGNVERGFEIWRTKAEGKPPFKWERVLDRGAGRFSLNASVASMVPFNGALYIGTGLPGLGVDRAHDVGPAAAELVRLWPDGKFDLIVGEPRFSAAGLQVPTSAMLPGFDDSANSVIWRMCVYNGTLYVATHHWGIYKYLTGKDAEPTGGFHIWATTDGETFTPVTTDGFGDAFAVGIRTLVPTTHGLVIGTDDHGVLRDRAARMGADVDTSEKGLSVALCQDPDPFGEPRLGPFG
jgi:hypothetical protein